MINFVSYIKRFFNFTSVDHIKLDLIYQLMHKLIVLLKANIPIIQCIELLEKSEQSISMKKLLYFSKKDLCSGKKISESFLSFSEHVEPFFYRLLRVGEETGRLEWAVQQLVHYLEVKVQFEKKIKQALFYPVVVCIISFLLLFSLFVFVIPEFAALFHESTLSLPIYTEVMFNAACFVKKQLPYIIFTIIMTVFLTLRLHFFVTLKKMMKPFFSRNRFFKQYREKRYLTEFCQQMAACLSAGVSMIDSLTLIQSYGVYTEYKIISDLIKCIKSGITLSLALEKHHYFPIFMIEMIKIGESSGSIEKMLFYLSNHYQEELEGLLMKLKAIIEPLILCILGVLIGFLVLSIYMPIFKLGSVLQ